jgi:RNA polymerase sigma-70 factor (ECF subfamily)
VSPDERQRRFETLALPHLDAAFNLARWLTRNDHDAEDVVQDAFMRAHRYLDSLRGDNARPWLLQIVRNTCFTWLRDNRPAELVSLDDGENGTLDVAGPEAAEPPAHAMRNADRLRLNEALAGLPFVFREVLVLRELEDLSYRDIARIADIPLGTVMSRLSRARALLRSVWVDRPGDQPRVTPPGLHAVPRSPRAAP